MSEIVFFPLNQFEYMENWFVIYLLAQIVLK